MKPVLSLPTLRLVAAIVFSVIFLGACRREDSVLAPPTEAFVTDLRESPLLAERVARGELPPLEERLPKDPMVVPTYGPNAWYGGELRIIIANYWDYGGFDNVFSSRLVRHVAETDANGRVITDSRGRPVMKLVGNLVSEWKYSEDGRTIDMTLRDGIRYSDGHPFTTEDIAYRWAIWNDTERYKNVIAFPAVAFGPDQPVNLEVIDRLRFRIHLPAPDFRWLSQKANFLQFWETPKHWLGQYDPSVNPEAPGWDEFKRRIGSQSDLDRPVLGPWKLIRWEEAGHMIAERNPYFYMVDKDGRQLPYIDSVRGSMVRDPEVALLRALNGRTDIYDAAELHNLALIKNKEARGNFNLGLHGEGPSTFPGLMINFFSERDRLGEYLRRRDFRTALSLAIDREEVNDLVFEGLGIPTNVSIEDWFRERNATYDPSRASALLDGLGLKDTNGDRIREYPEDGKPVTLVITTLEGVYATVAELAASHLQRVGINAVVQNVHPNQYAVQRKNREFDLLTAHNGSFDFSAMNRTSWSPFGTGAANPAQSKRPEGRGLFEPFARYHFSGGKNGMPAPDGLQEDLARLLDLQMQFMQTRDDEEARSIARRMSEIWADNTLMIGIVGRAPVPLIISRRVLNVPDVINAPDEGVWVRAGLYPYQLVLDPRSEAPTDSAEP